MARTRILSDEQILGRVGAALSNAGNTWTLANAAAAAGLHPATLIKRFGSRQGLLVALSRRWVDNIPSAPTTEDPYQELLAWMDSVSTSDMSGPQLLTHLDMLVEDLRDPQLRSLLHDGWQRHIQYLTALVAESRQSGQVPTATSPGTVAQLLLDTAHGSLLRAAVAPEPANADPGRAVRRLLGALT
ncbi:hypothetical protein BH24ACT15_BH24ACT15_38570 [soil metagenome]